MRILILEPDMTGHHAPYLRHMIMALSDLGQEIVVATRPGATQSTQFALHLSDVANRAVFDESASSAVKSPYRNVMGLYESLHSAIQRHRPEHVWVPYADILTEYLAARALLGYKPPWQREVETEGLYFRGRFAYPVERWHRHFSRFLMGQLVQRFNWTVLHLLDPIPCEILQQKHPDRAGRIRLMPDPVESVPQLDPAVARGELGIPTDGRMISCIGVAIARKSIATFVSAFRQARISDTDRLLLAGPMSDETRHLISEEFGDLQQTGRIITIDRHLNLREVMLAVMASDLVCIPSTYRIGSSSFLIRAASARRPVLADGFGWTGWVVPRFYLGWSADMRDAHAVAEALPHALEGVAAWRPTPAAKRFVQFHAAENFQAHWTARLRERLQLPPDQNYVPWEWVLKEPAAGQHD
jgi:hypothetical protein